MLMKEYQKPIIEILIINEKDVITASGEEPEIDVNDFE